MEGNYNAHAYTTDEEHRASSVNLEEDSVGMCRPLTCHSCLLCFGSSQTAGLKMLNVEETFQNAFQFEVEKVNNFYVSQV
jgi:hypothetical protein